MEDKRPKEQKFTEEEIKEAEHKFILYSGLLGHIRRVDKTIWDKRFEIFD